MTGWPDESRVTLDCGECLAAISVAPPEELEPGSALAEHARDCLSCARALAGAREINRQLASAIGAIVPREPAAVVAERAVADAGLDRQRSARRSIATAWMVALAAMGFAVVALGTTSERIATMLGGTPHYETQTFRLDCLTGEQAADVVRPYLTEEGARVFVPNGVPAITVRAPSHIMAQVYGALVGLDQKVPGPQGERCVVAGQQTAPAAPAAPAAPGAPAADVLPAAPVAPPAAR